MYFNVVINDSEETDYFNNQLVFYFGKNLEKAKEFAKLILEISDYYVEIIPLLDKKEN